MNQHALGLCPTRASVAACSCSCSTNPLLCPPKRSYCWPLVPLEPGDEDPAWAACQNNSGLQELRATPRIESSGASGKIPRLDRHAVRADRPRKSLLAVLRPGDAPSHGPQLDNEYVELIDALSRKVGAALDDPAQRTYMFPKTGPGNQHVYTLPALNGANGLEGKDAAALRTRVSFRADLARLVERYAQPLAASRFFDGAPARLSKLVVSRSVHLPEERHRTRAMLWHYDSLQDNILKLLVYLSPVPHNRSGCMLALKHNTSGEPFKMRFAWRSPWGQKLKPVAIAQPWMADLLDRGYRPSCLTGPAGTIVGFNTNIVHRGSRPAAGMRRDCVLLELVPAATAPPQQQENDVAQRRRIDGLPPTPAEAALSTLIRDASNASRLMPMVGFGTANRKSAKGPALVASLSTFFDLGGRLVDTAQMYRNYAEIGRALKQAGTAVRDGVWLVSKVNTNRHVKGFVNTAAGAQAAVRECLKATGKAALDVMLIHLPWENSAEERLAVWKGLVAAQAEGLVRYIGTSNFNRAQIEHLAHATGVWPAVNELEYHPWVQTEAHALVQWCRQHGMVVIAYGSLGGSKNIGQASDAVAAIAKSHGVSNAQVLLRWALQRGVVVIPGATSHAHIADNLALARMPPGLRLSEEDLRQIDASGKPSRFKTWKGLCAIGTATDAESCKPSV